MTIILRIFSDFCCSTECKLIYEKQLTGEYKDLYYGMDKYVFITDGDDYTHAILLNTATPVLKEGIEKERVIGLSFEPRPFLPLSTFFIEYAKTHISRYYIGDKDELPEPFTEGPCYMWHTVSTSLHRWEFTKPIKKKTMSIMCSQKTFAPGHQFRHEFVKAILSSNLPIDIYGRGHIYYRDKKDDRIKGDFKELEPYEEYDFHIAIENFPSNHYFSEKVVNPLLCHCTPLYLGCRNAKDYFGDQTILLSGDLENDLKMIQDILANPDSYKTKIDIDSIRRKTGLLENIDRLFPDGNSG